MVYKERTEIKRSERTGTTTTNKFTINEAIVTTRNNNDKDYTTEITRTITNTPNAKNDVLSHAATLNADTINLPDNIGILFNQY